MKEFKKILTLGLVVTAAFGFVGCKKDEGGKTPETPEEKPSEVVKTRVDNREDAYIAHLNDKTELGKYKSLYEAIEATLMEGDRGAYVTVVGNDEQKVFVNFDGYAADSKDMFWYYSNGNQLAGYSAWKQDYSSKLINTDYITVMNEYANYGAPYMNGHKVVGVGSENGSTVVPVWNTFWDIESSATVDMIPYSGITKEVYDIELSKAEISPAYDGNTETMAFVGFLTVDSYYMNHMGIRCDTKTGNWYYYTGNSQNQSSTTIDVDKESFIMGSTWNEEKQCFIPNHDVKMTLETKMVTNEDGDEYLVNRLTINTGEKEIVKDFEDSALTQCGTIRFSAGLDIVSDASVKDYMNGSYFKNVVVKSATGYAFEDVLADYGALNVLNAGEYNLLNSSEDNPARYQTVLYTPSIVSAEFNGSDVYNFSYDIAANKEEVYAPAVQSVYDQIKALPTEGFTTEIKEKLVDPAAKDFDALTEWGQAIFTKVNDSLYKKLQDAIKACEGLK